MKFIVHTENDYVVSLELSTSKDAIEIPDEVYNSNDLTCYKFIDGKFTFDDVKKAELEQKAKDQEEINQLKAYLNSTDYIWNSIKEGGRTEEYYAEVITKRKEARKRIQELEDDN